MGRASWIDKVWQDLQPTPGRLSSSLRIVLTTVLTLILLLVWQVPFASVGLYFIFIVGRDSPSVSLRSSIFAAITLLAAVATEIGVVVMTDNDPMARVVSVAVVAFIAALLSVSTTLPALPPIWGFIFATLIALWENHIPADATVKISLWILGATAIPLACSTAVEYIFGYRQPVDQLQAATQMRYRALEAMFKEYARDPRSAALPEMKLRVTRLAAAGQSQMQQLYNAIVDRNLNAEALPVGARVRISMLAQLMDVSAAFASQDFISETEEARQRYAEVARFCHELSLHLTPSCTAPATPLGSAPSLLTRIEGILVEICSMPAKRGVPEDRALIALPSKKVPFIIPGALKKKENVAFALKLSLCATFCYIFYFAVDWPGISTSVTTVFITGLSTTGAIKQKHLYRILGSIIGGLFLGIGASVFLFPHMDSITSLLVLIAVIAFIAAWMAGGRLFNYVGLQIAFSFYLVALEGASAPTRLAPARDRLVGILVALIVMWFVFDRLWPVRTITVMRRTLAIVLQNGASLFRLTRKVHTHEERLREADILRDRLGKTVASLRTMNDEVTYEFGVDREAHIHSSELMLRAALTAVALFWNELAALYNEPEKYLSQDQALISLRDQIADSMERMANAVANHEEYAVNDAVSLIGSQEFQASGYEEYARNGLAHFKVLQATIAALNGLA